MLTRCRFLVLMVAALLFAGTPAMAGEIFLTGHDPDFHAQSSAGAQNLLRSGLSFVTGGTFDDGASTKFLWVESRISAPGGNLIGENGLGASGVVVATNSAHATAP